MDQDQQQSDHIALLLQQNSKLMTEIKLLKRRNQILSERVEYTRQYKSIQHKNKNLGLEFQIEKTILIDAFEMQTAQLRDQLNDQLASQIELSHTNQSLLGSIHTYKQQHEALHAKICKHSGQILALKQHIECSKSHLMERDAKLTECDTIINDQNIIIDDLRQKLEITSHNGNNLRVKSITPVAATWDKAITSPKQNDNAFGSDCGSIFSEVFVYKGEGGSSLFSVRTVSEEALVSQAHEIVEPWPTSRSCEFIC